MKRALLALGTALAVGCGDVAGPDGVVRNQDFLAEAALQIDLDAVARTSFRVEGINGTIEVVGTTGTEAFTIRGARQVRSESVADARDYLDRLVVEVTQTGSEILIRTVQPSNTFGRGLTVNYVLTVPARLAAHLDNVNGALSARAMLGAVAVSNVNGIVTLNDLSGAVAVALVNGNIACRAVMAAGGTIDLRAVNGNVVLDIPLSTSAQFAAHLVNGSIGLSNLTLQNVVSSPTSLTGRLGSGQGTIDLRTVNGTILARGF